MSVVAGTPRLRALAAGLRRAREEAKLSTRELAKRLNLSQPLISNWENGRRVPRLEQVAMVVAVLRTEPSERDRLIALARNLTEPNWLTVGVEGISEHLVGVVECESAASRVLEWSPMLVPGLLQTPAYARFVVSRRSGSEDDFDARLIVRMGRREVLRRQDPAPFEFIIGEEALRNPLIEPALMAEQVNYLIEMATWKNITVRVMPSRRGWHPGLIGPFVLYEFSDSGPVIYFEHFATGAFVPDERVVAEHYSVIESLHEIAESPEDSMKFMESIGKE